MTRLRPDIAALTGTGAWIEGAGSPSSEAQLDWLGDHRVVVRDGDVQIRAAVYVSRDMTYVCIAGQTFEIPHEEDTKAATHTGSEPAAVSPMSGLLAAIHVEPGQAVAAGTPLFVVEAMKMEYVVRAPRDVTVDAVNGTAGEQVDLGEEIVMFAPEAPQ